jgi:hypothetical protein
LLEAWHFVPIIGELVPLNIFLRRLAASALPRLRFLARRLGLSQAPLPDLGVLLRLVRRVH